MKDALARHVLASMRCGVVAVDPDGRLITFNRPAAEILGAGPEDPVGRDCREVLANCPALAHLLLGALERTTLPDRAELELEIGGERRCLIGFSLSRIEDDRGTLRGSAIFFKDLTLVEEERERETLRNRLANLGEVAAQLAHEVRNRLGGIRLFLGLARRRLDGDAEGEAYLERADAELLEANAKMGEILNFVRPVRPDPRPADAAGLCREALDATLARFPGAAPRVAWQVQPGLPPALADAGQVRDALANLFANALEAAGPDCSLQVSVSAEDSPVLVASVLGNTVPGLKGYGEGRGSRIRIEIADDGPGVPPEVLRRIFLPFFTTKEMGSGLGVPTAQKILDAHGGALDVISRPGQGATFVVRLPAAQPEESDHG